MAEYVTLSCPSCGGKLQISNDLDRFACSYCGQEHLVKRSGGIVALAPVVDAIIGVQIGVDKTATELAIVRLEKEIVTQVQRKNSLLKSRPSKPIMVYPSLFIAFSLFLFIASLFSNNDGGNSILIVGIVFFFGGLWSFARAIGKKAKRDQIDRELISLGKSIEAKKKELNNHKHLVSGETN